MLTINSSWLLKMFLSQMAKQASRVIRPNASRVTIPTKWGFIEVPGTEGSIATSGGPNRGGPGRGETAAFVLFMGGLLSSRLFMQKNDELLDNNTPFRTNR